GGSSIATTAHSHGSAAAYSPMCARPTEAPAKAADSGGTPGGLMSSIGVRDAEDAPPTRSKGGDRGVDDCHAALLRLNGGQPVRAAR
ncbi:MAG TPA: hypothetical protein VN201_14405, partial [Roseateles sp.]|nr:hypothetical protein [Roseateles sp.]